MRCPSCGNDNPEEFAFCIECGTHIGGQAARPPAPEPDPWGGADRYQQSPRQHVEPEMPTPIRLPLRPARQPGPSRAGADAAPADEPDGPTVAARLVVLGGATDQTEFSITGDVTSIGRAKSNDVVLNDTKVSRQHARIVRTEHGFTVEDCNSRNGTRVNEQSVYGTAPLSDGAVLRIGDASFRFAEEDQAGRPERSSAGGSGQPIRPARSGASSGQDAAEQVPVVFAAPWAPLTCPRCHGIRTIRPIVYGPAAVTPAAQQAAERGEVVLGGLAMGADGANAQCGSCNTRVRIVPTTPE